jgi:hypothetical protein
MRLEMLALEAREPELELSESGRERRCAGGL